jgi:hypothetical protein
MAIWQGIKPVLFAEEWIIPYDSFPSRLCDTAQDVNHVSRFVG